MINAKVARPFRLKTGTYRRLFRIDQIVLCALPKSVDRRVKILRHLEISAWAENIMMANKSILACRLTLAANKQSTQKESAGAAAT
jgi:hypothetical protein